MSNTSNIIEVPCDTVDDDVETLIDILNGLVYLCTYYNWFGPGHRNEIILNLTVSTWMLDLSPENVLDELMDINIIDPCRDNEDTCTRMKRMLNYTDSFSLDYMINTSTYISYGHSIDSVDLREWPVRFKLK